MQKIITIGRSSDADINLSSVDQSNSISRFHASLTPLTNDVYELKDEGSSNGVFTISQHGEWVPIKHSIVTGNQQIKLGLHETNLQALLQAVGATKSTSKQAPSKKQVKRIRRNPITGEIYEEY